MTTQEQNKEAILQELQERVAGSIDLEGLTDDAVQRVMSQIVPQVEELLSSPEFVRKFRFDSAADAAPSLRGSKFARLGLGIGDIEMLYDVTSALHRMQPQKFEAPSEELENAFNHVSAAQYVPQETIRQTDRDALDKMFPRIPLRDFSRADRELAAQGKYEQTEAYQRAQRAMDTA